MASHESAFRPLTPDSYKAFGDDDTCLSSVSGAADRDISCGQTAEIISLHAYKVLKNISKSTDIQKVHDLELLLPLINEARLRPVRFYRGLNEWLLEHNQVESGEQAQ